MSEVFKNKVAESGIVTIDLGDYYPKEEVSLFDMKDYLFMGLILKEKDFRESLKQLDIAVYQNKVVAITCSADAVIPMWAYMLVATVLQPVAKEIIFADEAEAKKKMLLKNISAIPTDQFKEITKILRPVAKSIMYGEPCSTVPVFKKERAPLNLPVDINKKEA